LVQNQLEKVFTMTPHFDKAYRNALHTAGTRYAKLAEGDRHLSLILEEFRGKIDTANIEKLTQFLNLIQRYVVSKGLSSEYAEKAFTTNLIGPLIQAEESDASRGITTEKEDSLHT